MKYLIALFLVVFFQPCYSQSETQIDTNDYPQNVRSYAFRKIAEDTLTILKQFDKYDGSEELVGVLSSINNVNNDIYLTDYQRGKVIVLDKNNYKFKFSFGSGPGKGPGDLNDPFALFLFKNELFIAQYSGRSLFSVFSLDGKFLRNVARKSFDFNVSPDRQGAFISGSVIYFTNVIARDLKKVMPYQLDNDSFYPSILPVNDFNKKADSLTQTTALTKLFILQGSNKNNFFAIPGNKPLINTYESNGKLLSSYDLRNIPVLKSYYTDLQKLIQSTGVTYFTSAVVDPNDNIYLFANVLPNVSQLVDGAITADKLQTKEYVVMFNTHNFTYSLFRTENRGFVPLKIIGKQLWSFDRTNSQLVIHQLK